MQESAQNEISEVDKAVDELKLVLLNSSFLAGVLSRHAIYKGDLVRKAAERLVNAIEAEKSNTKKQVETEKKMEEEAALTYGQAFSRVFIDQEGNFRKESIPFKEIYKEPEPKSLLKDVSEFNLPDLPEWQNILVKYKNGQVELLEKFVQLQIQNRKNTSEIKKFCTLTDFINAFEQLQRDVKELKSKAK